MNIDQIRKLVIDQAEAFRLPRCARCHETIEDDYLYILDRAHYCEECAHAWLERHRKRNRREF